MEETTGLTALFVGAVVIIPQPVTLRGPLGLQLLSNDQFT